MAYNLLENKEVAILKVENHEMTLHVVTMMIWSRNRVLPFFY